MIFPDLADNGQMQDHPQEGDGIGSSKRRDLLNMSTVKGNSDVLLLLLEARRDTLLTSGSRTELSTYTHYIITLV